MIYQQSISIHERYAARPERLEQMCLAQFASLYDQTPKKSIEKNTVFDSDGCSGATSDIKIFIEKHIEFLPKLPKYLDLTQSEHKLGYMKIRKNPYILRMHRSKKKEGLEEYYAELLLYYPWRDEEKDLKRLECDKIYHRNKFTIQLNKKGIFPNESVIELLENLEKFDFESQRPKTIFDTLDPQMVQDDEDLEVDQTEVDPEFAARDPEGFKEPDNVFTESRRYKTMDLPEEEDLESLARQLVPEQLRAFSKVVKYCKDCSRARKNINHEVKQLRMIIHGGSGSGKSNVLRCISFYAEKILRKAGGAIDKPRVLICAHTGMAAKIVNGATLCSVFRLDFSNEHTSLSDKELHNAREQLSELELIIIDELSMVSADVLYKLHLRLCEIFQSEEMFGDKGIILVGDLMQLKPIMGRYIFEAPAHEKFAPYFEVNSLWHSFEVINLRENHRQGDALIFSRVLNKVRMGDVDTEVEELLKTRLIDGNKKSTRRKRKILKTDTELNQKIADHGNDTSDLSVTHVFYTNEEVSNHNSKMLNLLPHSTPLVKIRANIPPGFKPKYTKHGTFEKTQFKEILSLKKGARVMLISNIDVLDGLVNGSLGHIVAIEEKNGIVEYIIIAFDDKESGVRQRQYSQSMKMGRISFKIFIFF